ncbi:hypothetical protein Jiend_05770 [Micromonospora endophytica]|uniref:hypothetical protein n=1 Tax=Micromonospora endophytica TaxID=515350 RepID=UPI001C342F01|nr:hypothetical protein [Micromonospora endophytica]BCJ57155.1 hypothetical protein Jiend_05770 [Micromonospora endophytica]
MQLRVFSLPRSEHPVDQVVAKFWSSELHLLAGLDADTAKKIMQTQACWGELRPYGADRVWAAIQRRSTAEPDDESEDDDDLRKPEWLAFTAGTSTELPDFTTRPEPVPHQHRRWLRSVVLVPGYGRSPRCTASPGSTPPSGTCSTPPTGGGHR